MNFTAALWKSSVSAKKHACATATATQISGISSKVNYNQQHWIYNLILL